MVYESWFVAKKAWIDRAIVITEIIKIISLALRLPYVLKMVLDYLSCIRAYVLLVFDVLACKYA